MKKNYLRYIYFFIGMIFVSQISISQPPFMIDKVISQNKIVNFNNQKLLIIDFWATWCGPCGPAIKQLEILQESKPNDVYIVSVSDEKEELISVYLQKNPINLAVLKDYPLYSLIDFFKVQRRPYAVLLTLDGKVLFQGHPSDITASMIDKQAAKLKLQPNITWSDLFFVVKNKTTSSAPTQKEKELTISKQSHVDHKMYIDNGIFYYSGPLSELIKYLTDSSNFQIIFDGVADYGVSMSCDEKELLNSKPQILNFITNHLSLSLQSKNKLMETYLLEVTNSKQLWDDKQINWGNDVNPIFIVGTDRIEADNITIKKIANLLSDIKGTSYYYTGNDNRLYDWSFHYRFDDLMTEDLLDNFGIKVKKDKVNLPVYTIKSLNP